MPRKTKMNSLTSPKLLAKVNPQNIELMNEFRDYLKSTQRSETTISAYMSDLKIAWVWCLQHNKNRFFVDWTKKHIIAYQSWLLNTNDNSPARIRRLKSSLSSLSNYIEAVCDDEFPDFKNIINKIESPANKPVRPKTVLTPEEIERTLNMLIQKSRYQMACFIALAAYSGRRKSELCRFKVEDFSDEHLICGGSLYKSDPIKTKGRADGKYLNCYTLAKRFKPYLDMWMQERERLGIDSKWLFVSPTNYEQQLNPNTVNSWMISVSKMTGINHYAHAYRHAFTTFLSNEGLPDTVIKDILGWADVSMVGVYVDRETDDTLDMYFDENGIKQRETKGFGDL